jgi:hypothetical protein
MADGHKNMENGRTRGDEFCPWMDEVKAQNWNEKVTKKCHAE